MWNYKEESGCVKMCGNESINKYMVLKKENEWLTFVRRRKWRDRGKKKRRNWGWGRGGRGGRWGRRGGDGIEDK